jgi:Domain of unknown function (DUF2017)
VTVVRRDGDLITLELTEFESELLGTLLSDYEELVRDSQSASEPGDDAVIGRLFPSGYRDDPDAAAEFARYTRSGLVERKTANAGAVSASLASGARIDLSTDGFDTWLPVLTDLRLVLAERIGIQGDDEAVPADAIGEVYQWLGELQWFLLEALDDEGTADEGTADEGAGDDGAADETDPSGSDA